MLNLIKGISTIIFIIIWIIYICKKIENKKLKDHIKLLCILLIFWIIIRIIKYEYTTNEDLKRYLWYLYYLPELFASTIFMIIGTWHNKNKKYIKIIKLISIIGSFVLFILTMTNDFHNLVFKIDISSPYWESNYTYGPVYYLCFIWTFINVIISITSAVKYSKGSYKKQKFIILTILFVLVFTYAVGYINKSLIILKYIHDFIIIYSIFYMIALIIILYKEKYRITLEETLYSEIEEAIKDKTILINKIINEKTKLSKDDLAYIKLLVSYCKGKSNLVVVQKNKDYYTSEELKLIVNNAIQDSKSIGVIGAINIINKFDLSVYNTSIIYSYIYNLFEYATNYKNTNILISIDKNQNYINIKTMVNTEDKIKPFEYNYEMNRYIETRNIKEEQTKIDDTLNISIKVPVYITGIKREELTAKEHNALLQIKSKVHDILGQRLSIISSIIDNNKINAKEVNEIKPLLNNILEDLNSDEKLKPTEMLIHLTYTCKLAGTNLYIIGNLPKNDYKALTLVKIIRECSTNAIRRAKAKNIYVTINEGKKIEMTITNDGKVPRLYIEGDGIKGLKMRVKELNGDIEIKSEEKFIIKIRI